MRYHVGADAAGVLEALVDRAERREIDPGAAAKELLATLGLPAS